MRKNKVGTSGERGGIIRVRLYRSQILQKAFYEIALLVII